jgi:predicted TIM-barrel fold metal-dependent hydrolase
MTDQHSKPKFRVPAGACDCHMHIFGPPDKYPGAPQRSYTPREASFAQYQAMAAVLGLQRIVFVQPSTYGADNSCLVDTLREAGGKMRGVAVIDEHTSDRDLEMLKEAGVRGVRVNVETSGVRSPSEIGKVVTGTAARIRPFGLHLQLFAALSAIEALYGVLRALPVPLVIDHMGLARGSLGTEQPGFDKLLELVAGGAWVKVSGVYRVSTEDPNYSDAAPIAKTLIAANPKRIVWGSDWPHTGKHGGAPHETAPIVEFRPLDDGQLLDLLADWADEETRDAILVDNPAELYGFEARS